MDSTCTTHAQLRLKAACVKYAWVKVELRLENTVLGSMICILNLNFINLNF